MSFDTKRHDCVACKGEGHVDEVACSSCDSEGCVWHCLGCSDPVIIGESHDSDAPICRDCVSRPSPYEAPRMW